MTTGLDPFTRQAVDEIEENSSDDSLDAPEWPTPNPAMFTGPAGEFVDAVAQHTEADPVALLVHFLVGVGNMLDRGPYVRIEAAEHYSNLYALLVGPTSSGRKGTAWGQVRRFMQLVAPEWVRNCIASGLSSGEGVIYKLRSEDEVTPIDRRLLVVESEFGSVLRVVKREGNTLSPVLRNGWDGEPLRSLTKNSPLEARDVHLSIVGHITLEELTTDCPRVELANGLLNRFLVVLVKRAQLLPEGGGLPDLSPVARRLSSIDTQRREIKKDPAARRRWCEIYEELDVQRSSGLVGAITGRAEAHILRLAGVYTALDGRSTMIISDLEAALAVVQFVQSSVAFIFGDELGDPLAGRVLEALTDGPSTLTGLHSYLGGHIEARNFVRP